MNTYNTPGALLGFEKVCDWYGRSVIDYSRQYIALYTAYNAWYREVLATTNDRQAITLLKKRFVIWDDYYNGRTLRGLRPYMEKLADLTQKEPLQTPTKHWNGELDDSDDWQSLIEYWYQVRCLVVHGVEIKAHYVWLAYETLDVFMQEIIRRAGAYLKAFNKDELKVAIKNFEFHADGPPHVQALQQKLFLKYIALPDIWQVDMQRTPNNLLT